VFLFLLLLGWTQGYEAGEEFYPEGLWHEDGEESRGKRLLKGGVGRSIKKVAV